MKRNLRYMAVLAAMVAANANAQDAYNLTSLTSSDLNGTARYVGMGGAMNALGADISTMQSNPAGIGLYRKGDCAFSLSNNTGDESRKFLNKGENFVSFDQLGVVFSFEVGDSPEYFNIGFNYHKDKAYHNVFFDARPLGTGLSQTYQMEELFKSPGQDYTGRSVSDMAEFGYQTGLLAKDEKGNYIGIGASEYGFKKYERGSRNQLDFSLAFNFDNQFYFGAAVGCSFLSHEIASLYSEENADGGYDLSNYLKTTGTAVDFKVGAIIRPIEDNPFRFGISISTPTAYYMKVDNGFASIDVNKNIEGYHPYEMGAFINDYRIETPWKFGLSAATTVGTQFAIDAEYEYQDWSSLKYKYNDDVEDAVVTGLNSEMLKGVSTFKVGAEYKVTPKLSLRAGYNYVSPMFHENSFRNLDPDNSRYAASGSDAIYTLTSTDFSNLYGINRYTCGIGFRFTKAYLDFAYQLSSQKGEFYAFDDYQPQASRKLMPTSFTNKRNQVMLTLGYKF